MKKALIAIFVIVLIGVSVKSCMAILPKMNMKPSDYDLGLTFKEASSQDKPIITVFYTDWCTYCQKFMPRLDKVRNIYSDNFNVVLIDVEKPENKQLVEDYRISAFPTLYIIDPKFDNRVLIDSSYYETVDSLGTEVSRYGRIHKLLEKGTSCK